ncbi:MAG: hypothetical protein IPO21_06875 [Bacteroidales bacterium]|nr:hypothetical protein [Bacteroidales bacterium]
MKNNEQFQLSALVIAGSWIENMYITTYILATNNTINSREVIISELNNQKYYLNKINELLIILNQENNPYVVKVLESFSAINTCYANLESTGINEINLKEFKLKIQEARNNLSRNK